MVIKLTLDQIMLKGSFCSSVEKYKQVSWERDWKVARLESPNLDIEQTLNPLLFYLFCFYCGLSVVSTLINGH